VEETPVAKRPSRRSHKRPIEEVEEEEEVEVILGTSTNQDSEASFIVVRNTRSLAK